jgi:hypothetical protein
MAASGSSVSLAADVSRRSPRSRTMGHYADTNTRQSFLMARRRVSSVSGDAFHRLSSRAPSRVSHRHFVRGCFIVARLQDSLRTLVHDIDLIALARFPEWKRRQAGRYCGFACIVSKGNIDVSSHSGQRLAQLTAPLGKDVLVLAIFVAAEGLSELFEINVVTLSRNEHLDSTRRELGAAPDLASPHRRRRQVMRFEQEADYGRPQLRLSG